MEKIKLCKSFKFLTANLEKRLNKRLKEKDLSITQGLVLLWLRDALANELPIKDIEKKFGTAQSTTHGVVNRLEQKNLVTTYLNEHRSKIIKITQEGLRLAPIIEQDIKTTEALLLDGFTQGERAMFIELLKKAENNFLKQHDIEMGEYYE